MAETKRTVKAPVLKIAEVQFTIEGLPPGLLVNRRNDDKTKDTPAADAILLGLHPLQPERDGCRWGFPVTGIRKSIAVASGRGGTVPATVVRANLFILGGPDGLLPIDAPEPVILSAWAGKAKGMNATQIMIHRGLFWPWQIVLPCQYNESKLTADEVAFLIELAGFSIGIGSWRPENDGPYGRFRLKK